jgi:hypothetical protein
LPPLFSHHLIIFPSSRTFPKTQAHIENRQQKYRSDDESA